mmetsp:Transcript_51005/g.101454  ORF Transcript_51005/g.101454 Transcript_51005/m.101454 type:complete len:138 (+) Transcript_51005:919-1332(+)
MLNPDTVLAEGDGLELGISGEAMKLSPPNDPDGLDVDAPDVGDLDDLDALEAELAIADEKSALYSWGKAIFERLDADGMGTLSAAELKAGMKGDAEAGEMLADWDFDAQLKDDGEITWLEFEQMLDKQGIPTMVKAE